ncbi:hypothetical protein FQZ97_1219290 [compost metagenome]
MQVVEVGDPAAVGGLVLQCAGLDIQAQPGIATGAGQADIQLGVRPFGGAAVQAQRQLVFQPLAQGQGQALRRRFCL